MRHDVPNVGPMSEQYPHLIFSNLTSKIGQRTMNILKYLFPVPKEDSHRTITFVNQDDYISFRFDKIKNKFFFYLKLFLVIISIKKTKVKLN
jgi:U3 small nucleolar ribonucleoprotein protein IMP4